MAHYLVRAKPLTARLAELRAKLDAGEVEVLEPFGRALHRSLMNAKVDDQGHMAAWEEEDYCRPPLAMERAALLDHYFTDLTVESVNRGAGWQQIESLPSLWEQM